MTQYSTRAASPPASNSLWGRLPKGPWPVRLALLAVLLLAVPFLIHAGSTVHAADNEITGVTLTSLNPGELAITWDAPSRAPSDYRVTWKKSGGNWPSYKNDNTALGGNAFPTGTSHTVTGLEEGTEYSVRVRARYHDGGGNVEKSGPWSTTVNITVAAQPPPPPTEEPTEEPTPPAKPTGLTTSPSHNRVVLAWTNPDDDSITGYQILRGPDAASLSVLTDDTESTGVSYTDSTVTAETTYAYAIKAKNTDGLSPESDPVTATTPAAPAPPAKPMGLSTDPSHNNVVLAWTDPADSSITSYQVLRGSDADNLAVLVDNTGKSSLSYTDSTVTAETTYAYAIRARNADGLSPQSDPVSVTTPAAPVLPAKPTGLSTNPSHNSVVLAWTDPNDNSITGYQVLRGPDAANLTVLNNDTGSGTASYTDNTVDAETTYAYAIRAKNAQGLSPQSDAVSTTTPAAPPAKPTGISYGASHNNVLLLWTDPDDDSITSYQVLRGPDAATLTVLTEDTGSTDASYSDDTVSAETTYAYAIKARNARGLGPQSDTVSVTTQAAPEEPVTEEQVAGVDFTLDGQELDTTGTCSETDIGSIVDDCTIDIETKSPVFAVDGTVDSDDRIGIRTGRDLAAAQAASEVATADDLRGADQTVTLTFPEGRSLLRLFGDENEVSGGSELHFFRVNVVPYWEWNGNILSKDSDCRDTTSNAPAVDEITHDDCIVAPQFGNTAELRFFNVINEHFNVYVEVNGTNVISEPSTSDLGSSFTVNLDAGDNLIRVRLAAKGGAAHRRSL